MISLAAAAKAGAVCMALLSPDVLTCRLPATGQMLVCEQDGCISPQALARSWRGHPERRVAFLTRLYGGME